MVRKIGNNSPGHEMTCKNCQQKFIVYSPNWAVTKRCPVCRRAYERLYNNEYRKKRKANILK